jgi:aerobic carbon-monoxide dehydrogenase medium subunit
MEQYGDEAKILAGGQSLIALLALRLATPTVVVDIDGVRELDYFSLNGDEIRMGALARHRALENAFQANDRCPIISEAVGLIASAIGEARDGADETVLDMRGIHLQPTGGTR